MHTVTCVRTLSIGPRRHGPRLCMHRPRTAKGALRRPRSRERRCPVAASRCTGQRARFWRPFRMEEQLKSSCCRKKGLHPARPTRGRAGTAMAHSSRAPTPARAPKHRSLADFKPSAVGPTQMCSLSSRENSYTFTIDSIDISSQTTGQKSAPPKSTLLPCKPPEASGASADHSGSGVRRRVSLHPPAPSRSSRRRPRASVRRA